MPGNTDVFCLAWPTPTQPGRLGIAFYNIDNLENASLILTSLHVLGLLGRKHAAAVALPTLDLWLFVPVLHIFQCRAPLRAAKIGFLTRLLTQVLDAEPHDGALDLVRARPAFLQVGFRQPLFVEAAPGLRPHQLRRLLALEGKGLGLGRSKKDGLAVTTDEELARPGPDPILRECAQFGCGWVSCMSICKMGERLRLFSWKLTRKANLPGCHGSASTKTHHLYCISKATRGDKK